jgi:hypothetical protein
MGLQGPGPEWFVLAAEKARAVIIARIIKEEIVICKRILLSIHVCAALLFFWCLS